MNESSTISVIERDNLTREMLSRWIDSAPGFRCVGGYADTRSALQHLSEENPDLILVDLHLPGAIEYVRHLKPLLPGTGFVMLTVYEETDIIFESLAAGATGCLSKNTTRTELLAVLMNARRGVLPMASYVARKILHFFYGSRSKPDAVVELRRSEKVVLELLARGYRDGEIAAALDISIAMVNTHVRDIYGKLQARSQARAAARHSRQSRGMDIRVRGFVEYGSATILASQETKPCGQSAGSCQ